MSGKVAKGGHLPNVPRKAWSLNETAAALGISYNSAWSLVTSGQLAAKKVGGEWRVLDSAIDAYLNSGEQAAS